MISAKVPYSFLSDYCHLTWQDIEFGLRKNYISPTVAIDFANSRVGNDSNPDTDELAIATSSKEDLIFEPVKRLAAREAFSNQTDSHGRWLCILLTWLYNNREMFEDPLGIVEEVYSDFDYPSEIAPFVRYMPNDEPSLGTKAKNDARLIKRWGDFVTNCRESFGL